MFFKYISGDYLLVSFNTIISRDGDWFRLRMGDDMILSTGSASCLTVFRSYTFLRVMKRTTIKNGPMNSFLSQPNNEAYVCF